MNVDVDISDVLDMEEDLRAILAHVEAIKEIKRKSSLQYFCRPSVTLTVKKDEPASCN